RFKEFKFEKYPDCPVCSENPLITELIDYELFCGIKSLNKKNKTMSEHTQWEITVEELKEKMDKGESFFLLDVREAFERDIATLGGTNISIKVLPEKFKEIESHKDEEVIVYCRSGSRSHYATEFL